MHSCTHSTKETKLPGILLPHSFSQYRYLMQYDPYQDIRKNIMQRNSQETTLYFENSAYVYYVETNQMECQATYSPEWTHALTSGNIVCVECHLNRQINNSFCNGQGSLYQTTRWEALGVINCKGTWHMISQKLDNGCLPLNIPKFIFI